MNESHQTPPEFAPLWFLSIKWGTHASYQLPVQWWNMKNWLCSCFLLEHFTDCTFLFIKVALSHTLDTQNAQWFQHLHILGCLAFERVGFLGILDFSIIHWLSSHELGLFPCPPFWSTSSGGNHPAAPWLVGLPGWCGMASRDPKIGMLIKAIWFGENI